MNKRTKYLIFALLALSGCVSGATQKYVGQSQDELFLDWGKPINTLKLSDGRTVHQYRWGGGTFVTPTNTTTTANVIGTSVFANSTTTGGNVISSEGCLVSFIMSGTIVAEARYPKRAFC